MYTIYTQDLCGYCTAAKQLLDEHNYTYKEINITENESAKRFLNGNNLKTVPQIFVSGIVEDMQIYVGDYTMLKLMVEHDVVSWDELEKRNDHKREKLKRWSDLIE